MSHYSVFVTISHSLSVSQALLEDRPILSILTCNLGHRSEDRREGNEISSHWLWQKHVAREASYSWWIKRRLFSENKRVKKYIKQRTDNVKISNTILSLTIILHFHQLILYAKVYVKFIKPSEGYDDPLCRTDFSLRLDTGFSDDR